MNKDSKKEEDKTPEELAKYFDEANYNTIIVKAEPDAEPLAEAIQEIDISSKEKEIVAILAGGDREMRDEALKLVKQGKGKKLLLKALTREKNKIVKEKLLVACWESGADLHEEIDVFLEIFESETEFTLVFEAFTILENCIPELQEQQVFDTLKRLKAINKQSIENYDALKETLIQSCNEIIAIINAKNN